MSGQLVRFKRVEITPQNFIAIQVRNATGDPITHEWATGFVKTFYKHSNGGTVVNEDTQKVFNFNGRHVIGSTEHIRKANCLFVCDGNKICSVTGVDGNPFPDDALKIAKPPNKHAEAVKNRTPGQSFTSRYKAVHKSEDDVDGWPIPAVYGGKILFYHRTKGFGFVSPFDSNDQQDPANLYFRKQHIITKGGPLSEPRLGKGMEIEFQIGRQMNGKPTATYITLAGGKLIIFEEPLPPRHMERPSNSRMAPPRNQPPEPLLLGNKRSNSGYDLPPSKRRMNNFQDRGRIQIHSRDVRPQQDLPRRYR